MRRRSRPLEARSHDPFNDLNTRSISMAIAKQDILDAIGSMSVLELPQLIKDMEEKFGVSAAAAVAVAAPAAGGGAGAAAAEEKTEFNVILLAAGENKVNTI